MNLTLKNNFKEFDKYFFEKIDLSLYKHKFIKDYLEKAERGLMPIFDGSAINVTSNSWIVILHGRVLLIYGNNWTKNQIEELSKVIDLNTFTNYTLAGDNTLID